VTNLIRGVAVPAVLRAGFRATLAAVSATALAGAFAGAPGAATGPARVAVTREPLEVHSHLDGWAESPALAASPQWLWVAYEVTGDRRSDLWLARVPRGSGTAESDAIQRLQIGSGSEVAYRPSLALLPGPADTDPGVWIAWTSFREGAWAVKACLVKGGEADATITLSEPGGLQSWVRVRSGDGVAWFVWSAWDRGRYRILARSHDGELGPAVTVYEGPNPAGRPDVHVEASGRAVFVWDEYIDGRFAVRSRRMADGRLDEAVSLGGGEADCYEPRVAGRGEEFLACWHAVPAESEICVPAASMGAGGPMDLHLGRAVTEDTWRVRAIWDRSGSGWLAWTTRHFFRNTPLFLRRVTGGSSRTVRIDFDLPRNFMNTFECLMDNALVVAWDHSGSVYLDRVELAALDSLGRAPEFDGVEAGPGEAGLDRTFGTDWDDSYGSALRRPRVAGGPRRSGEGHAVIYQGDSLRVYFGDYHNHTSFSDGRAYPDISFLLARDRRGLDFAGISDHDVTVTPAEYIWTKAVADLLARDGRFATVYGFEPSKGWAREGFGHWNAVFPGEGEVLHFEPGMTPDDLYHFARERGAIMIPHHVAKRFAPHSWDYNDPEVERVVEICSQHGIFERAPDDGLTPDLVEGAFVEDGLARGYIFGLVGASDSHNCFEAALFDQGLTGVYARGLTRAAVMDALRRRRTFALTGGNIVVDFRCNGRMMGEEIAACGSAEPLVFAGCAWSADPVVSVEIVSGGRVVYRGGPGEGQQAGEARFTWTEAAPDSQTYYYLRAATAGGDLAWSSPIWIVPRR